MAHRIVTHGEFRRITGGVIRYALIAVDVDVTDRGLNYSAGAAPAFRRNEAAITLQRITSGELRTHADADDASRRFGAVRCNDELPERSAGSIEMEHATKRREVAAVLEIGSGAVKRVAAVVRQVSGISHRQIESQAGCVRSWVAKGRLGVVIGEDRIEHLHVRNTTIPGVPLNAVIPHTIPSRWQVLNTRRRRSHLGHCDCREVDLRRWCCIRSEIMANTQSVPRAIDDGNRPLPKLTAWARIFDDRQRIRSGAANYKCRLSYLLVEKKHGAGIALTGTIGINPAADG